MALTKESLALGSITTEPVARATSRPRGLGPGALATLTGCWPEHLEYNPLWFHWAVGEEVSGPLGLAQPTGPPHGHLLTWTGVLRSGMGTSQALSHPPIPHHSPYFCPDTELLAFSPPHSLLPSAQVPSSGPLRSQYGSKLSLPSRLQASRPQSGLGWISLESLPSAPIHHHCPHQEKQSSCNLTNIAFIYL